MGMSMAEEFALLDEEEQQAIIDALEPEVLQQMARGDWWFVARPEQIPPDGVWTVFLYLAGRGAGKTRSGAEWMVDRAEKYPLDSSGFPAERLVMAYSLSDARLVCIEGPSGILRVLERKGYEEVKDFYKGDPYLKYHYVKSPKPHITLLETGTRIFFSGSEIDAARGLNLADVWMDEPIKWADAHQVWREGIRPALRADLTGDKPRAFVTTTPRPIRLLQEWVKRYSDGDPAISLVRGSTFDNKINLSEDFLEDITQMYAGTALGRQELYGELLDAIDGALFSFHAIDSSRVEIGPERVAHRTVGVDPGLTGAEDGDEMGVVVACRSSEDHIYVLADETTRLAGRDAALHAWRVFEKYGCDTLVYESNLGKAWMHQVFVDAFRELQQAGLFPKDIANPPLAPVFSNQGKKLRAEPVAMRYSQGRVHHIGRFEELEKQMLGFDPITSKQSPDRLDALVHACRHLIEGERRKVRILSPLSRRIDSLSHEGI